MPKSNNPLLAHASGTLGKQVVIRRRKGDIILAAYPEFKNKERTKNQQKINKRMIEADEYAQSVIRNLDERDKAQVRLDVTRNKLYTSLVSEYFRKFRKEEEVTPAVPVLPSALEASTQFVRYLLQTTDQSPEQIAALAKVPVEFVLAIKGAATADGNLG